MNFQSTRRLCLRHVGGAVIAIALIAYGSVASAQLLESQCIQDNERVGGRSPFSGNFCTANDLTFSVIGLGILDDGCTGPTDTVDIFLRAVLENTGAGTRYDTALWIAEKAGTLRCANSGDPCTTDADCGGGALGVCAATARWGQCAREIERDVNTVQGDTTCGSGSNQVDLTCGLGRYINDDGDQCGDIRKFGNSGPPDCGTVVDKDPTNTGCNVPDSSQDSTVIDFRSPVRLDCVDVNDDGLIEIPACASWGQSAGDVQCWDGTCSGGSNDREPCVVDADCPGGTCQSCRICNGSGDPCVDDTDCQVGTGLCHDFGTTGVTTGMKCWGDKTTPCTSDADCRTCVASADPVCRSQRAVAGTSSKCRCEEDLGSNVPMPALGLSCSCTSTTVGPGGTVNCTVTYTNTNPVNCTPDTSDPERYRCGTGSFFRFDVTDGLAGPSSGDFTVQSVGTGSTNVASPDEIIEWTPASLFRCSLNVRKPCVTNSDCLSGEGTCSVAGGSPGIVGPGDTAALNFDYTAMATSGSITLTTETRWANTTCSGGTRDGQACELYLPVGQQCPGGGTCVLDFTSSKLQALQTTCSLTIATPTAAPTDTPTQTPTDTPADTPTAAPTDTPAATPTPTATPVLAAISGQVRNDTDGDGDPGDPDSGVSGVTLDLWSDPNCDGDPSDGVFIASESTDASGNYRFDGLAAGCYVVIENDLAGWLSTGDSAGLNDNRIPVDLRSGMDSVGNEFLDWEGAAISGQVRNDTDGDGDPGDPDSGVSGVTLDLWSDPNCDGDPSDGVFIASESTDASGNYRFDGLAAGCYVVIENDLANWSSTADTFGLNDNRIPVDLRSGMDSVGNEFLDWEGAAISGQVRNDTDGDGDLGDPGSGISGVTLDLWSDPNCDGDPSDGVFIASESTDASGNYRFGGLAAGCYVVIENDLANWSSTADTFGLNDNRIPVDLRSGGESAGNVFLDSRLGIAPVPVPALSPGGLAGVVAIFLVVAFAALRRRMSPNFWAKC